MAAFVTVLICSNLIGPAKIVQFDWLPFAFGAGVLFFPVSYVFGDILTEVYGYARARRVIMTAGRWLWTRTIGSTIVGEAVDSALFYPLAFYNSGLIPNDKLLAIMLAQFGLKVAVEVLFTPITYKVVSALKRAENADHYDRETSFTPFSLKT